MRRPELPASVLERRAIVYVRQSTFIQVVENLESQRRQYELASHARDLGFRDIMVIDDDLGMGLIRSGGHLTKGGYGVQHGRREEGEKAPAGVLG